MVVRMDKNICWRSALSLCDLSVPTSRHFYQAKTTVSQMELVKRSLLISGSVPPHIVAMCQCALCDWVSSHCDHASFGTRVCQVICSCDGYHGRWWQVCQGRRCWSTAPVCFLNWSAAYRANETLIRRIEGERTHFSWQTKHDEPARDSRTGDHLIEGATSIQFRSHWVHSLPIRVPLCGPSVLLVCLSVCPLHCIHCRQLVRSYRLQARALTLPEPLPALMLLLLHVLTVLMLPSHSSA